MANDEYEFAGRGALKLKGSKVKKNKKKQKEKSSLETALVTRDSLPSKGRRSTSPRENPKTTVSGGAEGLEALEPKKHGDGATEEDEDDVPVVKTAAEKRFDEARRKKLLQMTEASTTRPELFKTHKERVEELNTYLSKLSEHHDMPKIGPG